MIYHSGRIVRTLAEKRGLVWSWYTRHSGEFFSACETVNTSRVSHVHGESSRQNDQLESRIENAPSGNVSYRKKTPRMRTIGTRTGYGKHVFVEFMRADPLTPNILKLLLLLLLLIYLELNQCMIINIIINTRVIILIIILIYLELIQRIIINIIINVIVIIIILIYLELIQCIIISIIINTIIILLILLIL